MMLIPSMSGSCKSVTTILTSGLFAISSHQQQQTRHTVLRQGLRQNIPNERIILNHKDVRLTHQHTPHNLITELV